MKKISTLVAVALLFLPLVSALDCTGLGGVDFHICNYVQKSDLNNEEKDLLILDILNPSRDSPKHDFVYSWNTNLNIEKSPDNKYKYDGVIKKAWLKIMTPMPSVIEENVLYVQKNGRLMTSYNYEVELPTKRYYRDCKTRYYPVYQKEDLDIYLNGKFIGSNKLNYFSLSSNKEYFDFTAQLNLEVRYKVFHYRKKKTCVEYEKGICVKKKKKCRYSYKQYKTDRITLTDSFKAKQYKQELKSSLEIINKYNNIVRGEIEADNFTKLVLNFDNSFYQYSKYKYSFDYTLPDYLLTIRADKIEEIESRNINDKKFISVLCYQAGFNLRSGIISKIVSDKITQQSELKKQKKTS